MAKIDKLKRILESTELDNWKIQLGKHYIDLGWYSLVTAPVIGGVDRIIDLGLVDQVRVALSNTLIQFMIIVIIFVTLPLKTVVNQAKNELLEELD